MSDSFDRWSYSVVGVVGRDEPRGCIHPLHPSGQSGDLLEESARHRGRARSPTMAWVAEKNTNFHYDNLVARGDDDSVQAQGPGGGCRPGSIELVDRLLCPPAPPSSSLSVVPLSGRREARGRGKGGKRGEGPALFGSSSFHRQAATGRVFILTVSNRGLGESGLVETSRGKEQGTEGVREGNHDDEAIW